MRYFQAGYLDVARAEPEPGRIFEPVALLALLYAVFDVALLDVRSLPILVVGVALLVSTPYNNHVGLLQPARACCRMWRLLR